jgi:hypothetical protein
MQREELYKLVDTILNRADRDDLEVIRAALKRRDEEAEAHKGYGGMEISPKQLAEGSARSIAEQMSYSRDTLRNMIKNFAVDIIRKEAPELSDAQVRELLHAWIPDPDGRGREGRRRPVRGIGAAPDQAEGEGLVDAEGLGERGSAAGEGRGVISGTDPESGLPKDLLVTMIEQFIAYSEGRMSVREQAKLHREIPNWQEVYWKRFSPGIRDSLSLYLKGTIDHEDLWLDVYSRLEL